MPHGRSAADGDDFASTDEVKIYKDEGEDEKRSSENLSEEKFGLVTETEEVRPLSCSFPVADIGGGPYPWVIMPISGRTSEAYCYIN